MKQLTIIITLTLIVSVSLAQTKTTPPPPAPASTYSIKGLTEQEYSTLFQVISSAKETVIYAPNVTSDQKVNIQAVINQLVTVIQAKGSKDVPDTTKKPAVMMPSGKKKGGNQ